METAHDDEANDNDECGDESGPRDVEISVVVAAEVTLSHPVVLPVNVPVLLQLAVTVPKVKIIDFVKD